MVHVRWHTEQMLRDHKLGSHHDYYATRVEFLNVRSRCRRPSC